jgi:hypothetical protein
MGFLGARRGSYSDDAISGGLGTLFVTDMIILS